MPHRGAWGFGATYSAPYLGYPMGDVTTTVGGRHGLYRFHIMDPIRFQQDLRVTIQALGWRSEGWHLPLQDDTASVAYWYRAEPHAAFPALGDRNALETLCDEIAPSPRCLRCAAGRREASSAWHTVGIILAGSLDR